MDTNTKSELFTDLSQEQSETVQGGCWGGYYGRGYYGGGYYAPRAYYYAPRAYYYAPRAYYGGYRCRRWYY